MRLNLRYDEYTGGSTLVDSDGKAFIEGVDGEAFQCAICDGWFTGYGNNAQPVAEGRCCDDCNHSRVIPERLRMAIRRD